jgi:hypothetical protein
MLMMSIITKKSNIQIQPVDTNKPIEPVENNKPIELIKPNENDNTLKNIKLSKKDEKETKPWVCCGCCRNDTEEARCCGLCFYCGEYIYCNNKDKCCYKCITADVENSWCFKNPCEYFESGCFLTDDGNGNEPECCCTLFAGICLCKFAVTSPWLLCSIFNGFINCICGTDKNYLF